MQALKDFQCLFVVSVADVSVSVHISVSDKSVECQCR